MFGRSQNRRHTHTHGVTPLIAQCTEQNARQSPSGTNYLGTDGPWNGANSPIGPWSHGYEGGAERGYRMPSIALIA